jgi:hypothetical protein
MARDPIYHTDAYPINGCTLKILSDPIKTGVFHITVLAPEGEEGGAATFGIRPDDLRRDYTGSRLHIA